MTQIHSDYYYSKFLKNAVGFDCGKNSFLFCDQKFPHYDIYEESDATILQVALAGYSKDDVSVTVENSLLTISHECKGCTLESGGVGVYKHKGIAKRSFKLKFAMGKSSEVTSASMENGVLTVKIMRPVKQVQVIKVN